MHCKLICLGKTKNAHLSSLIQEYIEKLNYYTTFELVVIPDAKTSIKQSLAHRKKQDTSLLLKHIKATDNVILLDERGKEMTSVDFAHFIEGKQSISIKNIVFVIGGAYGVSESFLLKTQQCISFSKMTFSHQMIRLFFLEQLYRAFTIINGHPYHH